ncbi:HNH homing endonuclease [Pseudoalteromonas phage J2-1_QLiu-2017]|nr:HNH homing endonuclease [Pseudoalteromonas phage J2-1_QLiu-2017]
MRYMQNLKGLGFPDHCITNDGKVYSNKSNRFLTAHACKKGYLKIKLYHEGYTKSFKIHRLVAYAFLDEPEGGRDLYEVNHKDTDKQNNLYTNLEYVTSEKNIEHAIEHNLRDMHKTTTDEDIHNICKFLTEGHRIVDIASMVGVSTSVVKSIKYKHTHTEISDMYGLVHIPKKQQLSTEVVIEICEMLQNTNMTNHAISKRTGVSHKSVEYIKRRVRYSNISCNYSW